jgi:hypothetical protein
MSESGSRASSQTLKKARERYELECKRSDTRLPETVNPGRTVLRPLATSTDSQITRSDAQDGSQQSPISAQGRSLIAGQVGSSTSMTGTLSEPERSRAIRAEIRLMKQRQRNAAGRATRAREKASAGEAPSRTPVITEATSNGEGLSADHEKEQTESELKEGTRDRYDEMSGLGSDERDPPGDLLWAEEAGDDDDARIFIGSTFD